MSRVEGKTGDEMDTMFLDEVTRRSGEKINLCFQCMKCTAGCPTAPYMDFRPNNIIRMIQMGMKRAILSSRAIWLCVSCEVCGTRCPNQIDIGAIMDVLREMAVEQGVEPGERKIHLLHESFVRNIRRGGRVHEATMLICYKLKSRDLFTDFASGIMLFAKGKIPLVPETIRGRREIERIFDRCLGETVKE